MAQGLSEMFCPETAGELFPASTQIRELRFSFALLEQVAKKTSHAGERMGNKLQKSLSLFGVLRALLFRVHNRHLRIGPLDSGRR